MSPRAPRGPRPAPADRDLKRFGLAADQLTSAAPPRQAVVASLLATIFLAALGAALLAH